MNTKTPSTIQEWKYYADHNGGVNNLAVCRLNYPGDGAMAVAIGTSGKDLDTATRNAHRNLRRYRRKT